MARDLTANHSESLDDSPPDRLDRSVVVTALVVVAGAIMTVFDTTIVNVALGTLSRELGSPLSTAQWAVTGYLLALGMVIPLSGWATDWFGAKRVWIASLLLFTGGSLLCGLAWSMPSLIVFRVLQGLGGGMILPVAQTIIARTSGARRLGRAMSIFGLALMLGPILGPVLGGLLVQVASWHWIFFVNAPIGAAAIVLAAWWLPKGKDVGDRHSLDVLGFLLMGASLTLILYGLSEASSHATFSRWDVIAFVLAGALCLTLFVVHSLVRGESALINVRLFAHRAFSAGTATMFLISIALLGGMLLLPLYYQVVRGEGTLGAGLLLVPQGLGAMLAMPIAGRLTDRRGAGWIVLVGLVPVIVGTLPFAMIRADSSYWWLSAALFVRGIGLGSVMMPVFAAAYSGLRPKDVTHASSTLSAVQQIGGSFGAAIVVLVLSRELAHGMAQHGIAATTGSESLAAVPPQLHDQVAPVLADAFGGAFWVALAFTFAIFIPALFLPRSRREAP